MVLFQIRTQRTIPLICGTVKRFLLFGDHDGDVFATGGEMEIVQVFLSDAIMQISFHGSNLQIHYLNHLQI